MMMQKKMQRPCLLKQIEKQELEAQEFGFYWENFNQLIAQIQSECTEIEEAWDKHAVLHLQEEIGDLMQAAVSLAVFCKFDPYETLLKSIEKFQHRYNAVVKLANKDGHKNLHQQPSEVLMHYWKTAKSKNK